MKILDRYLLREIAGPFLFGVVAFVLLFVSGNILFKLTSLVGELGLSPWVAAELFGLWLPKFIVLTFPLATLVAILIVFGRLSGDSELVAMFAGGVSFRRLVAPVVIFGVLITSLTALFNEQVVPAAQARAEAIEREATLRAGREYHDQPVVDQEIVNGSGRVVVADSLNVAGKEMSNPVIIEYANGEPREIVTAKRARWVGKDWELYEGSITRVGDQPAFSATFPKGSAHFQVSPKQFAERARSPEDKSYRILKREIAAAKQVGKHTAELELALHHKLSIPFACLVFALIAPALGMRSHRGSGSIGMGLAILIGFAYYVVWNYLTILAQQGGRIDPFWAAWLPNVLTAAIGVGLIVRVRR